MARFFFADEALTAVAAELDSFDGRKDPERCASLVNKLRSCQDKLLSICNKMLEEVEPGFSSRLREHRAKFPDDIMTDNLAGQLWFGAECLAAGSSIMNKETESEAMRPLAKAVTKSLEKVRGLLREQCLSANQEYTETIRENLKIFDRLFADFEYNYVRCMVHVKSLKEYDLHQDLIVLFSETLARSIKQEMISQDIVDIYDPSLMFAIPRLAIVYGLLICPNGPLCVDRSHSDFPSLFLPFKNLLRKIRELLQTLEHHEVIVLEMLLCQLEEPSNIATKLKEVEILLANKEKSEEGRAQALKLQAKLNGEQDLVFTLGNEEKPAFEKKSPQQSRIQRLNSIPCQCDNTPEESSEEIVKEIMDEVINQVMLLSMKKEPAQVEIDCTEPEIRVSPRRTVEIDIADPPAEESRRRSRRSSRMKSGEEEASSSSTNPSRGSSAPISLPMPSRSSRSSGTLKRHNARRDTKKVPYKYQKDRRAKFKSTEDLIHRLYVCISGAADQLQSNYAADFRSILRVVFSINVSQDPIEEEETKSADLSPEASEDQVDHNNDENVEGATARISSQKTETSHLDDEDDDTNLHSIHRLDESQLPPIDLGSDALQTEMSDSLINQMLRTPNPRSDTSESGENGSVPTSTTPPSSQPTTNSGNVYAQNLNLHLHTTDPTDEDVNIPPLSEDPGPNEFFQPEPTLLAIATEAEGERIDQLMSPQETLAPDNSFVHRTSTTPRRRAPPAWVPDSEAPNCMGCHETFTLFRRKHHCRACGKVFCSKCSSHFMSLPQFGLDNRVRVCNRCDLLLSGADRFATSPGSSSDMLDGSSPGSNASSDPRSPPPQWSRSNFGMVS